MTDKKTIVDTFFEEWPKWIVRITLGAIGLGAVAIFTPIGKQGMRVWDTPDQIDVVREDLSKLLELVREISGEGKITNQPPGMSYVREPVTYGQPITLHIFAGRTDVGMGCILMEMIAHFTDESGVIFAGANRKPKVQAKKEVRQIVIELDQPKGMSAGRTTLQMQLEYKCGSETVFEMTRPVYYYAMEKER